MISAMPRWNAPGQLIGPIVMLCLTFLFEPVATAQPSAPDSSVLPSAQDQDRTSPVSSAPIGSVPETVTVAPPTTAPGTAILDGPALKDVPTWSQLARAILLTAIPDKYEDLKHWGMTREIYDGLRVRQRGLNIRVSERRKKVNHGLWYKYSVRFPNLEQNLSVVIDQVQAPAPGRFTFVIHVAMRNIRVTGQLENWFLGVKGLNFDVVSDVEVHLHAACELAIRTQMRPNSILPDLVLDPAIRSIHLDLADLETHRVGRIGGDIVEELGNGSRQFIKELMHSQEGRVLKKANEAIEKKRDSLRLPTSKLW